MAGNVILEDLLAELIAFRGAFILQNAHGSMEFQGDDLYLSPTKVWITIYHEGASNPESQSHLHLRRAMLRSARIARELEETPYLQFFQTPKPSGESKADIPENQKIYEVRCLCVLSAALERTENPRYTPLQTRVTRAFQNPKSAGAVDASRCVMLIQSSASPHGDALTSGLIAV